MILKIEKEEDRIPNGGGEPITIITVEFLDNIDHVVVVKSLQNTERFPKLSDVMEVTAIDRDGNDIGPILSGCDKCYLMNDEGKTVERIR